MFFQWVFGKVRTPIDFLIQNFTFANKKSIMNERNQKTLSKLLDAYEESHKETGATSMLTRAIRSVIFANYGQPGVNRVRERALQIGAPIQQEAEPQQPTDPAGQPVRKRPSIHTKTVGQRPAQPQQEEPAQRTVAAAPNIETQEDPAPSEPVKKKPPVSGGVAVAGRLPSDEISTADLLSTLPTETNAAQVDFEAMAADIAQNTIPGAANKYSKAELVSLSIVRDIPMSTDPQELSARQLVKIIKEHLKAIGK